MHGLPFIFSLLANTTSNSSSNSSSSLCHDAAVEHMMKPHRIPLTILAGLSASCMVAGSVLLLLQRNSLMFRRKAAIYLIIATIGLLLYMRDSLQIVWTYPQYNCENTPFVIYYVGAVPLHVIPVLVRSWRTYCIYRETPNIRCRMDTMLSTRVRKHKWMFKRMLIIYIPFPLISIFYADNEDAPYYTWIALEILYCVINLGLSWKLFLMRKELRSTLMNETVALFTYAIIACVETVCSNTLYIIAYTVPNSTYLILYYIYADILFCTAMWFLTGGKAIAIVWAKSRQSRMIQTKATLNLHVAKLAMDDNL